MFDPQTQVWRVSWKPSHESLPAGTKHAYVKLAIVKFTYFFQVVEWHITQLRIPMWHNAKLQPSFWWLAGLQTHACLTSLLKALWWVPWQGQNIRMLSSPWNILILLSSCSMAYFTIGNISLCDNAARLPPSFWCQRDFKRDVWRLIWKASDESLGRDETYICKRKNRVLDLGNNCETYKTVSTTDVPKIL